MDTSMLSPTGIQLDEDLLYDGTNTKSVYFLPVQLVKYSILNSPSFCMEISYGPWTIVSVTISETTQL